MLPSIEIDSESSFLEIVGRRVLWVEQLNQSLSPKSVLIFKAVPMKEVREMINQVSKRNPPVFLPTSAASFTQLGHYLELTGEQRRKRAEISQEFKQYLAKRKPEKQMVSVGTQTFEGSIDELMSISHNKEKVLSLLDSTMTEMQMDFKLWKSGKKIRKKIQLKLTNLRGQYKSLYDPVNMTS